MVDDEGRPPQDEAPLIETALAETSFLERSGISPVWFAFISLIIIFFLYQIVGGLITVLIFGLKPAANQTTGLRLANGLGELIFLLLPTLVLVRLASSRAGEFLRLRWSNIRTFLVPLVGIFSLEQMLQVYLEFQERIPLPEPLASKVQEIKQLYDEILKQLVSSNSVPELLFVILVVALIPAISEEFLFRGLVQRVLQRRLPPLASAVVAGIVFGAYHLNPFTFVPLVAIGIYLGFLAMRANSLWVSIAAHFYNNLFACVAVYFHLSDDNVVVGDAGVMSLPGLLLTFWFFGVVFLVSTYYFIVITRRRPAGEQSPQQPDNPQDSL